MWVYAVYNLPTIGEAILNFLNVIYKPANCLLKCMLLTEMHAIVLQLQFRRCVKVTYGGGCFIVEGAVLRSALR